MGWRPLPHPSPPQCPVMSMAGIDCSQGRALPSGPEAEEAEREGSVQTLGSRCPHPCSTPRGVRLRVAQ